MGRRIIQLTKMPTTEDWERKDASGDRPSWWWLPNKNSFLLTPQRRSFLLVGVWASHKESPGKFHSFCSRGQSIFVTSHGLTFDRDCKMGSARRMGCLWITVIWAGLIIMWPCNAAGLFQEDNGVSREVFDVEGDPSDVVWVVQVSDLHISAFHPDRSEDLRRLLAPALKMIRPSLVLITGDLTDGKNKDRTTTRQNESEWIEYQKSMDFVVKESGIEKRAFFDVRGNHDKYGVPYTGSYWDFFSRYSVSAQLNRTSTVQSISLMAKSWKYVFVGVDDSMSIGIRGPSNLFGHPNDVRIQKVGSELAYWDSQSGKPVTKIVFGHFPLSFTASTETGKRYEDIFAKHSVSAYICGHLHTKFGKQLWKHHFYEWHDPSGSQRYNRQGQFWEWELGDWRLGRWIRVIAIDGGETSFVDVDLSQEVPFREKAMQTIILPTFPLDSRSMQRIKLLEHEPRGLSLDNSLPKDTIRALIFSEESAFSVTAKIFDSLSGAFRLVEEHLLHLVVNSRNDLPLYQTAWNASKYSDPLASRFWLQIIVTDNFGTEIASISRPFSVNGKRSQFDKTWLSHLMIDIKWELLYKVLLWSNISFLLSLLLFPKFLNYYMEKYCVYQKWVVSTLSPGSSRPRKTLFLFPVWVLTDGSRNRKLWWAKLIYLFYLLNFPWFWGYATVQDHPAGSMSLQGWTLQFADMPQISGIGVPDIMSIVIPFMYLVVTPSFILIYCLSAERTAYYFHANSKSKCRQEIKLTRGSAMQRMCGSVGYLSKEEMLADSKVTACSICRGWLRTTLLISCLAVLWLHLRQCCFLKGAYGVMAVVASPGFAWPPPLLLAAAVYSTWSPKTSVL